MAPNQTFASDKAKGKAKTPAQNLLSILPAELQIQISEDLSYQDLCAVRATSRSLMYHYVDPHARLIDELARGWYEMNKEFEDKYYIRENLTLDPDDWITPTIEERVKTHAESCGFSPIVAQWLAYPRDLQFPCTKCQQVKPLAEFPEDSLYYLPPFCEEFLILDPVGATIKMLWAFKCGECSLKPVPGAPHISLGLWDKTGSYIVKCCGCRQICRAKDISPAIERSGLCEDCFYKYNRNWVRYKNHLQRCLQRMEVHETKEPFTPWKGFPACGAAPGFAAAVAGRKYRGLDCSIIERKLRYKILEERRIQQLIDAQNREEEENDDYYDDEWEDVESSDDEDSNSSRDDGSDSDSSESSDSSDDDNSGDQKANQDPWEDTDSALSYETSTDVSESSTSDEEGWDQENNGEWEDTEPSDEEEDSDIESEPSDDDDQALFASPALTRTNTGTSVSSSANETQDQDEDQDKDQDQDQDAASSTESARQGK